MRFLYLIPVLALLTGCFTWQPDLNNPLPAQRTKTDGTQLISANSLFATADNRQTLLEVIKLQHQHLDSAPTDTKSLALLATQYILLGAAYAEDSSEREQSYLQAMQLAARACYENLDFRRRIDAGEDFWQATDSLERESLDAMGFWVTALFYWYKDCQGPLGQMVNFRWIGRAKQVMERMTVLDPEWGHGMLHFTWGIYYLAIPEIVGGDRDLSAKYFQKAINTGPNWLQHRWGRGRYYHIKMENKTECRKDLEWVVAQDIERAGGPYAWRVYIQKDAREILDNLEKYFQ